MSTIVACRITYEPLRSLGFANIGANYVAVGGASLNPTYMFAIDNDTDTNLIISFDGVDDHTFVAAMSGRIYDYCANKAVAGLAAQPQNTRVYVRTESGGTPTVGSVYVTSIYLATV